MENIIFGIITVLVCCVGFSMSYYYFKKQNWFVAVFLIIVCGLILRIYVGTDLFLHEWDERYHALVAKNLIQHPFKPTLYDNPVLPYDYKNWIGNHTWLHKQPLPLWAMAFSIKIFGVNEISLRIPSIVLSTIAIYLTFYIARYLFNNKIALLAAFLHSIHGLIIETTGGRVATDHIDIFFLFFIELAVFLSIIFIERKKYYWNILVGISIGLAILCKWLPALIVLPIWLLLAYRDKSFSHKAILANLILILIICLITFLPWQIYIYYHFPLEAKWEQQFNLRHITEILEDHSGSWYYYLDKIRIIFGEIIYLPLIWLCYSLWKRKDVAFYVLAVWLFLPVLFFSFVKTKMQGYILFTAPAIFIITSCFFWWCIENREKYKHKWLLNIILILLIVLPIRYAIERIKPFTNKERNPQWAKDLRKLKMKISNEKTVVFNVERPIEAMFYTDFICYSQIPTKEEIENLKQQGFNVIIN